MLKSIRFHMILHYSMLVHLSSELFQGWSMFKYASSFAELSLASQQSDQMYPHLLLNYFIDQVLGVFLGVFPPLYTITIITTQPQLSLDLHNLGYEQTNRNIDECSHQ